MWDLVSYNLKHNLLNGENNQDGENNNHSYNHGEEGFTENPHIISLINCLTVSLYAPFHSHQPLGMGSYKISS